MNPKQFLQIGGIVLIIVGVLGMFLIGPGADKLFGSAWYFDQTENWAHLILGVVALIAAVALPTPIQKPLVIVLGIVGVLVGLYSLFGPVTAGKMLGSANLENPADTILHIVVGAWALWAGMAKPANAV